MVRFIASLLMHSSSLLICKGREGGSYELHQPSENGRLGVCFIASLLMHSSSLHTVLICKGREGGSYELHQPSENGRLVGCLISWGEGEQENWRL